MTNEEIEVLTTRLALRRTQRHLNEISKVDEKITGFDATFLYECVHLNIYLWLKNRYQCKCKTGESK